MRSRARHHNPEGAAAEAVAAQFKSCSCIGRRSVRRLEPLSVRTGARPERSDRQQRCTDRSRAADGTAANSMSRDRPTADADRGTPTESGTGRPLRPGAIGSSTATHRSPIRCRRPYHGRCGAADATGGRNGRPLSVLRRRDRCRCGPAAEGRDTH